MRGMASRVQNSAPGRIRFPDRLESSPLGRHSTTPFDLGLAIINTLSCVVQFNPYTTPISGIRARPTASGECEGRRIVAAVHIDARQGAATLRCDGRLMGRDCHHCLRIVEFQHILEHLRVLDGGQQIGERLAAIISKPEDFALWNCRNTYFSRLVEYFTVVAIAVSLVIDIQLRAAAKLPRQRHQRRGHLAPIGDGNGKVFAWPRGGRKGGEPLVARIEETGAFFIIVIPKTEFDIIAFHCTAPIQGITRSVRCC